MTHYQVHFQPDDLVVSAPAGQSILEAANEAGIILNAVCGGSGACNKCLVTVSGAAGPVRACQTPVDRDLEVTIPDSSRFFEQRILETGISHDQAQAAPVVQKYYLELTPPNLEDLRSDAARLIDAVAKKMAAKPQEENAKGVPTITPSAIVELPDILRKHDYKVTALCYDHRIEAVEGGDTSEHLYGVAVDLGTTTVVAHLVNLRDGQVLAGASRTNPQIAYGDDVVSRIGFTQSRPDGLQQLQQRIVECMNELIDELCGETNVSSQAIYEMTLAGNTTMQHIFAGVPVGQIAQSPYVAGFSQALTLRASAIGIAICPRGAIYIMPGVAAHVGGDAVAVALATGMAKQCDQACLAIDIGTNGELLVSRQGRLFACSTAAGPAFEGARIHQGVRAAPGAIETVHINSKTVDVIVIGDKQPNGICGSGLIDAIGELLKVGVLDPSGRLLAGNELPGDLGPDIRRRIIDFNGSKAFLLAESADGKNVILTQKDIREAQLGKAAIAAGIAMLLKSVGVTASELGRVYLAGAFGNYIRPENALRMGLLPQVDPEKVLFVGNAAGAGAIDVLRSRYVRRYNEHLAKTIQYVELAGRADFMELYSDLMMFPKPLFQ